jgi:glutathione S-transferase
MDYVQSFLKTSLINMRFNLFDLPFYALVCVAGIAWLWATASWFWFSMWTLLTLLSLWAPRLHALLYSADVYVLHSLSISHFVEKVRWQLDLLGVPYEEEHDVGIVGIMLFGRTVPVLENKAKRVSIGNSREISRFLWANFAASAPSGVVDMLRVRDETEALEAEFDAKLGVALQRYFYAQLLGFDDESAAQRKVLVMRLWGVEFDTLIPFYLRAALRVLYPVIVAFMRYVFRIRRETAGDVVARARASIDAQFDAVAGRLADGRRYLLGGDAPTSVDITFASLGALAVMPQHSYGGKQLGDAIEAAGIKRPAPDQFSAATAADIERWRASAAGQFVERMYRDHRFSSK